MTDSRSGVSIPQIRLPKGGGSIKGIGETFQPTAFTGAASFSIPIETPEARGQKLDLKLEYNSGGSQGPFGLGFDISIPHIKRRTEKRLPDYSAADEFVLSNAEYLVPTLSHRADDDWVIDERDADNGQYRVRGFRTRTEGDFLRVERWTRREDGDVHWRVTTSENVTSTYGVSASARIANPDDPRQVFQWLIEHTEDSRGNQIRYLYRAENARGVADVVYEENRAQTTQRYLDKIQYGNFLDTDGQTDWAFSVVFDYGDYDLDNLDDLTTAPTRAWSARADAFSDYRAGFEVRTHRLCRNILVFHHFTDELGARDTLVRSLGMRYTETPVLTLLREVQPTAYARNDSGWERQPSPALSFDFTPFLPTGRTFERLQVEDMSPLPFNFDSGGYQLVDIYGEGMAGLFYDRASTNLYYRPRGDGVYDRGAPLTTYPIEQHQNPPTYAVTDGLTTWLNVRTGGRSGFYELESEDRWKGFQAFAGSPVDYVDTALETTDVTGDGLADLLLFESDQVRVYPSAWREGHGPPFTALRGQDLPVNADTGQEEKVLLVDMVGDGLADRVRVRNGEVTYWPNLGYGKFGAPVVMANSPHVEGHLDVERLFLADIDGSGTTDLIYESGNEAVIYFNQSGNGFSDPERVMLPEPFAEVVSQIQFADVLGNGTNALVLSSGTEAIRHHFYDFSGGTKPYLLQQIDNHRGAVTRIQYAPSTKFYVADRLDGTPWLTRLPFPVHVVEKTESIDLIAHSKLVTRYAYHHGAYDFREREFAGFGLVERWDTEVFEQFTNRDPDDSIPFEVLDSDLHAPPILTRTWYHTGLLERDGVLSRQYADEYYRGDTNTHQLADSDFETPIDRAGVELAYRALRGRVLREEVYGQTGDAALDPHPYRVVENAYRLRFEQPAHAEHKSVYLPLARERLTSHYERNPADPRTVHELFLAYDAYGRLTRQTRLAYARRDRAVAAHPDQLKLQGVYTWHDFIHIEDVNRLGVPAETREFELGGLSPDQGSYYSWQGFVDQFPAPETNAVDFDQTLAGHGARLLSWVRHFYWNESLSQALPFGQTNGRALLHHSETAVYPVDGLDTLFSATGAEGLPGGLRPKLLSLDPDGGAFVERTAGASGRVHYVDPGVTVQYGGAAQFYQPTVYIDQFGTQTRLDYDRYQLLMVERAERLSPTQELVQQVTPDYRTLMAARVVDINDNVTDFRYDPIGNVRLISRYGTEGSAFRGDRPLDEHVLPGDLSASSILADPQSYLQAATSLYVHDVLAWDERGLPIGVLQVSRHRYTSDLGAGESSELQLQIEYTDGFGRALQNKLRAEPGVAWSVGADGSVTEQVTNDRWLSSGRTVYNNKGLVVKQYEPFYVVGPEYQNERVLTEHGVTAVRRYDPLGRVYQADLPKGFLNRNEYTSWSTREYDANDTVEESPYYDENDGTLPPDEQDALNKAKAHNNTPLSQALDGWGRAILDQQLMGADWTLTTYKELDVAGNVLAVQDPRLFGGDSFNFRVRYDMLGRPLQQISVDRGTHWTLRNAGGDEIHRWDGRGFHHATHYDALSRPIAMWLTGNGTNNQMEVMEYGEGVVNDTAENLRGRIRIHRDGAGVLEVLGYGLTGETISSVRQLRVDYQTAADWSQPQALEAESWTTQAVFDAFGRAVETTQPDGRQIRYTYHQSGRLRSVVIVEPGQPTESIVTEIEYNARGQRTAVNYGNGVAAQQEYDPLTFNVTRINSARASDGRILQDLQYVYDPAGNVTRINDLSSRVIFTNNQAVLPRFDYTYDAAYRLNTAQGREHRGLYNPADGIAPDYQQFFPQPPNVSDPTALENYTRNFSYDDAGNLLRISHVAASRAFTRNIAVSTISNRGHVVPANGAITPDDDYDENGNLIRVDHLRAMRWNSGNRLASVDVIQRAGAPNDAEYYVYDATGKRVRKVYERLVNGNVVIEETFYFSGFEVHRVRQGAVIQEEYTTLQVADGETRIASVHLWSTPPANQPFVRQTRYQLGSHLNSASFELDGSGQIITYEEYFPYGGTSVIAGRSQQEVTRKQYRYAGHERDATTQFYYFGARYYAPWMGRWISPDPAGARDGANLYSFVRGNPLRHVDRDGRVAVDLNNAGAVAARVEFFEGVIAGTIAPAPPTRTPQRIAIETELAALPRNLVAQRKAAIEGRIRAAADLADPAGDRAQPTGRGPDVAQRTPTRARSASAPPSVNRPTQPDTEAARPVRRRAQSEPAILSSSGDPTAADAITDAQQSASSGPDNAPPGAAEGDTTTLKGISGDVNVLVLIAAAILIALAYVEYQRKVNERKASPEGMALRSEIEGFDRSTLKPIEQGSVAAVSDEEESEDVELAIAVPGVGSAVEDDEDAEDTSAEDTASEESTDTTEEDAIDRSTDRRNTI